MMSGQRRDSAGALRQVLGASLGFCLSAAAIAGEGRGTESLALAGAEATSSNSYVFIGNVSPFPGSHLGQGLVSRLWLDWLRYSYDANGQQVRVNAPFGAQASLGYQGSWQTGWYGLYGGMSYRNSHFNPGNTDSERKGVEIDGKLDAEIYQRLGATPWAVLAGASYLPHSEAYWSRLRLTRDFAGVYVAGPEITLIGDPDYQARFAGLTLGRKWSGGALGFKAGARFSDGQSTQAYFGVEFSTSYRACAAPCASTAAASAPAVNPAGEEANNTPDPKLRPDQYFEQAPAQDGSRRATGMTVAAR